MIESSAVSHLAQHGPREALLKHLNHNPGIGSFRLAEQQMNMLRHDHVSGYHKAIALSYLFKNVKEPITPCLWSKKGNSVITAKSDEVKKSVAITAIEPGH